MRGFLAPVFKVTLLLLLSVPIIQADTISGTGSGGAIPDYSGGTPGLFTSDIVISDSRLILSSGNNVTVELVSLAHTWLGDLQVTLERVGSGGEISLFNRVGRVGGSGFGDSSDLGGTYKFNNSFTGDLWATAAGTSGTIPSGEYFPTSAGSSAETSFSDVWNGLAAADTWRLRIRDHAGADVGSLDSWKLSIEVADVEPIPEPMSMLLLSTGLAGIAALRRKKFLTKR